MTLDTIFPMLITTFAILLMTYLVSAATYMLLGQSVLRDVRARYAREWETRGQPTFVSFAIVGRRWARPISAYHFFRDREYRTLGDAELSRRADVVRTVQRISTGASYGFIAIGLLASLLWRAES